MHIHESTEGSGQLRNTTSGYSEALEGSAKIPGLLKCHSVDRRTSVPTGNTDACGWIDCVSRTALYEFLRSASYSKPRNHESLPQPRKIESGE